MVLLQWEVLQSIIEQVLNLHLKIPDNLTSAETAPLLCAGMTTFSPLKRHITKKGMRVGIVGIGGLGHLALQFANALGATVTAISSSISKENDAKKLGAHHFLCSNDSNKMKEARGTFDLILNTVSSDLAWPSYISLLDYNGVFCNVGAPPSNIAFPPFILTMHKITVTGSHIGGPVEFPEMLDLCSKHNIKCVIEKLPFDQVNAGMERVRALKVIFRLVLILDEEDEKKQLAAHKL